MITLYLHLVFFLYVFIKLCIHLLPVCLPHYKLNDSCKYCFTCVGVGNSARNVLGTQYVFLESMNESSWSPSEVDIIINAILLLRTLGLRKDKSPLY